MRLILIAAVFCPGTLCAQAGPLVLGPNSHAVVMQYEAWFGPQAVTFQGTTAKPLLQSADMQAVGGGYESADPAVIKQHLAWMEDMGVDAAMIDLTNNVACIFDSEAFVEKYVPNCTPSFRAYNQNIRDNTGNLYPAWSGLGAKLKLIPLLGGAEQNVLIPDTDGLTAFEKEVNYFGALMTEYPQLQVIYQGKPLMSVFLGVGLDPNPADKPLWFQVHQFLANHPEIGLKYTFTMLSGYIDSQPQLWAQQGRPSGPVEVSPEYGFWSWVDRLNPTCTEPYCPYYPSFNMSGSRVVNFTASIATAGQNGWGCPNANAPPHCPDDALRFGNTGAYVTLDAFMSYAIALQPTFLILHQFNEFVQPDEGYNADTDDDIEPADLWGTTAIEAVKRQIQLYRTSW